MVAHAASPLPGSYYWLLMMWGYDVIKILGSMAYMASYHNFFIKIISCHFHPFINNYRCLLIKSKLLPRCCVMRINIFKFKFKFIQYPPSPTPRLAGDLHNTTHTRGTYIRANGSSFRSDFAF